MTMKLYILYILYSLTIIYLAKNFQLMLGYGYVRLWLDYAMLGLVPLDPVI